MSFLGAGSAMAFFSGCNKIWSKLELLVKPPRLRNCTTSASLANTETGVSNWPKEIWFDSQQVLKPASLYAVRKDFSAKPSFSACVAGLRETITGTDKRVADTEVMMSGSVTRLASLDSSGLVSRSYPLMLQRS